VVALTTNRPWMLATDAEDYPKRLGGFWAGFAP